jgi:ABC-type multidrug transport system ATPase subunit
MTEVPAIETTGLTRRFGSVCAVDHLNLIVPRRSVYAFLGPNGAGKSTTIRLLLGLTSADSGDVRLRGVPITPANRRVLLRQVGAMVEAPSLYPHLTGRENLRLTQALIDSPASDIDRVLHVVRLQEDAHRLVRGYSQGMQQRLGLALALLGQPDLLILDEPTNGMDPAGMQEVRELIRHMPSEHGITVFLSSHLLGEVEQLATHVGIIGRGRLVFEGSLDDLRSRNRSRSYFETDTAVAATEVIAKQGWAAEQIGVSTVKVELEDRQSIARITAALISAGLSVYQVRTERPSLEELFLDLTKMSGLGPREPLA